MRPDVVYFDTEVLRAHGWPSQSVELQVFMEITKMLAIDVVIPSPAEQERRRQWVQDVEDQYAAVARAHKILSDTCRRWGLDEPLTSAAPARSTLEQRFDSLSSVLKTRGNIRTVPVADAPLGEVFALALARRAAFEERQEGVVGFGDTVILLSALYDLRAKPERDGAFVSADGVFTKPATAELAAELGTKLRVVRSLADLIAELRPQIPVAEVWAVDADEATAALKSATHLRHLLRAPLGALRLALGTVRDVEILDISNVQTPPIEQRVAGAQRRIAFDALLDGAFEERTIFSSGVLRKAVSIPLQIKAEISARWNGSRYEQLHDPAILSARRVPRQRPA